MGEETIIDSKSSRLKCIYFLYFVGEIQAAVDNQ